jgi:hypothetical protein
MWNNEIYRYEIPSEITNVSDEIWEFPDIIIEPQKDNIGFISISQASSDNTHEENIDLTLEQAKRLKSILEQYLQGK